MTRALAQPLRVYRQPSGDDGYEDPLGGLCQWPDGRLVANGTGRVFVWSRASGEQLAVHETTAICRDGAPSFRITFDPLYERFADAHEIRSFALWDLARWERTATFEGHSQEVSAVTFVGEDEVLSISGDSSLRRWDAWSGQCHQVIDTLPLYAMADDPTGDRVAVAGGHGRIYVLDRHTLALHAEHEVPLATAEHEPLTQDQRRRIGIVWNRPSRTIDAITWHPDKEHLLCGGWDFVPKMIHARTGRCVRQWKGHAHWVDAIAVDASTGRLVTASSDHTVRVWDLESTQCRAVFELPSAGLSDLMIDDGEILVVCHDEVLVLPLA